jgi:EAL domain-containing protein (putative c-di-GMP-specific phosphodiesterase class I)/CheY-like chemotaxis protein
MTETAAVDRSGDAPAVRRPRVLLVDDDPRILAGLRRQLHRSFQVFTAESGVDGLEKIATEGDFAVVVSDMRMPGMDGAAFLARVRAESPQSTRVLLTGQTELSAAVRAINDGQIFRFLSKPCPPEVLDKCLQESVVRHRATQDEHRLLSSVLSDRRVMETHGMYEAVALGLQVGIANRQFRLQYQPIVTLAGGRLIGVEAVVRWADEEGGIVHESTPFAAGDLRTLHMPLGRWVMAAACQEVASWPVLDPEELRTYLKLSPGHLRDPHLTDDLARTLILSGMEPHRVTIEIPQALVLAESPTVASLERASQWGVKLAVIADDGGRTMAELMECLRIDAVKVSMRGAGDAVESVVEVARSHGASVIADDVDTADSQAAARRIGCDCAQGALYGPPADPSDLLSGLAAGYR